MKGACDKAISETFQYQHKIKGGNNDIPNDKYSSNDDCIYTINMNSNNPTFLPILSIHSIFCLKKIVKISVFLIFLLVVKIQCVQQLTVRSSVKVYISRYQNEAFSSYFFAIYNGSRDIRPM